ncbi:hypothetical protein D3C72_1908600 [compost metagenome]
MGGQLGFTTQVLPIAPNLLPFSVEECTPTPAPSDFLVLLASANWSRRRLRLIIERRHKAGINFKDTRFKQRTHNVANGTPWLTSERRELCYC